MKLPLFLLFYFILSLKALAQNDTTYTYLDSSENICDKKEAVYIKLFYKNNDIWYLETYSAKTRYILQETTFSDASDNVNSILSHKEFADSGILYKRIEFVRGVKKSGFYYHPNGTISGTAIYNELGDIVSQMGFDENGGARKFYYYEKAPELAGDANLWRKHVYQNLKTARLYRNNAPNGDYRMQLNFFVDIDGTISDISIDKDLGYGTKEEAIRLLKTAGKWNAGMINGKKVRLPARLVVAFKLERQIADN